MFDITIYVMSLQPYKLTIEFDNHDYSVSNAEIIGQMYKRIDSFMTSHVTLVQIQGAVSYFLFEAN